MSTRGAVGFGTLDDWVGVYNHSDSMPTVLGARLWPVLTGAFYDLAALRDRLLAAGRVEEFLDDARASEERSHRVSSRSIDPLYFEWIYVVELGSPVRLHVGGSVPLPPTPHESGYEYVVTTCALDGREPDWRRCELRVTKRMAPMILELMRKHLDDEAYAKQSRGLLNLIRDIDD
ncbi:MAG TPA: hypothetical protein VHV77_17025 [Pirellulales bacterium]|jgi:hypothetical protein|nr:hypothetical protein [Pirellulales bacterium]